MFLSLAVSATLVASVSVTIAIGIWLVRSGLGTPVRPLLLGLAILVATVFTPFLAPRRVRGVLVDAPFVVPLLSLAVLVSPLLARPLGRPVALLYPVLAVVGVARAAPLLVRGGRRGVVVVVAGAVAVAVHLFVVVNERFLAHVYSPEFALLGIGNNDSYFHTAIVNMIERFGGASVGLDGVVALKYHVGSHYWFASLDKMAGSAPIHGYFIALLVVLVPAFLFMVQVAVICLRPAAARPWLPAVLAVVAVVALDIVDSTRSHFTSESHCFGLLTMFASLPLAADLVTTRERTGVIRVARLAVIPLLVFLAISLKVPVGLLLTGAFGWVLVRGHLRRGAIVVIPVMLASAGLAWRLFAAGSDQSGLRFSPLRFFALHPAQAVVISLVALSVPLLLGWIGRRTGEWSRRDVSLPELACVVAIGAGLNAYLFAQPFLNIAYFLTAALWFAVPLVLARGAGPDGEEAARQWIGTARTSPAGLVIVGLVLLVPAVLVVQTLLPRPVPAATDSMLAALRRDASGSLPDGYVAQFRRSLTNDRVLFGAEFTRALDATYGARAVARLRTLARRAGPRAGVFVPPGNDEFWSYTRACDVQPFFVPALVGLPMVKGLPPSSRQCKVQYFGYEDYDDASRSRDVGDDDLCAARPPGVDAVIVLRDVDLPQANTVVRCGP